MGQLAAYLSANQGLGMAAYVAGLLLVWLVGFLASAWLYGRWEARRRADDAEGEEPIPAA
jgi:hypothetical protein